MRSQHLFRRTHHEVHQVHDVRCIVVQATTAFLAAGAPCTAGLCLNNHLTECLRIDVIDLAERAGAHQSPRFDESADESVVIPDLVDLVLRLR